MTGSAEEETGDIADYGETGEEKLAEYQRRMGIVFFENIKLFSERLKMNKEEFLKRLEGAAFGHFRGRERMRLRFLQKLF